MKRKNAIKNTIFDRLSSSVVILVSSLFLIFFSLVLSLLTNNWLFFPIGISVLLVEIVLFWLVGTLSSKFYNRNQENLPLVGGMTLEFLMSLHAPIAILGEKGEILWYNRAFQSAVNLIGSLYKKNINDITDEKISLRRLREEDAETQLLRPVTAILSGEEFSVISYKMSSEGKVSFITVWESLKGIRALKTELAEKNPIVSYIAVDNYSEAASLLQSNYRTITAKISILLKEWSSSMDGILREVESDRYILILEEKYLKDITEKRYDILDRVREISTDNVEIPVTISIGTACIDGSMQEKEQTAHNALDLALQRGGDQAVLKLRGNATEYYGGRTKTVQKRTKIRSRIIASEVKNLMEQSSNILIMGHRFADHDSIGSGVGMARFAMQYCKKVNIVVNVHDTNLKGVFQKLSGIPEYRNLFIDGPTAQDLITSTTLLIITDVNNARQFEAPELFENTANVVIIDHHRQSAEFAVKPKITYIEPSASRATELVADMLEQQHPSGSIRK